MNSKRLTAVSHGSAFHLSDGLVFRRVDGQNGDAIVISRVPAGTDPLSGTSHAEHVIATTSLSGFASAIAHLGFDGETAETHKAALDALEKPSPEPSSAQTAATWLREAANAAKIVAGILPEPAGTVVRLIGAGATAAAVGLDQGLTDDEVVARIHRVHRLDVAADDAAIDAELARKPPRP